MQEILSYCLKFSVTVAIIFLFYQLVLRRLTFYNWNRYYLLGYSLLSFVVAFINISPLLKKNEWSEVHFIKWVPVLNTPGIISNNKAVTNHFTAWDYAGLLLLIGIAIMFIRLIIQLFSFFRMMKKAEPIAVEGMKCYQVNDSIIPFSFGNSIFINRHLHKEEELQEIIRHEFVHVKQKHSIDIICGELLCLFNWYNPFAWLLKRSIRQNLEFIADNKVLENGINKKEYQYLLLKVIGNNQFGIASKFNFSSLKKRIAMMNKMKSARVHIVKFLFILPLIAVMLLAFRSLGQEKRSIQEPDKKQKVNVTNIVYATTMSSDATPETKKQKGNFTNIVYMTAVASDTTPETKTNKKTVNLKKVSDDFEITNEKATIHLKDGTTEKYDLKDSVERKNFEDKYGKLIEVNTDVTAPVAIVTSTGAKTIAVSPDVTTVANLSTTSTPVAISSMVKANVAATTSISSVANVDGVTIAPEAIGSNSVAVIDDYGYTITGKEDVLVTITKNSTEKELEDFKKQMKEKGIELTFDQTTYNDKGVLTYISGTMKSSDGHSNFVASDFEKLILATIKKGEKTYFKVSVKDKTKMVI